MPTFLFNLYSMKCAEELEAVIDPVCVVRLPWQWLPLKCTCPLKTFFLPWKNLVGCEEGLQSIILPDCLVPLTEAAWACFCVTSHLLFLNCVLLTVSCVFNRQHYETLSWTERKGNLQCLCLYPWYLKPRSAWRNDYQWRYDFELGFFR